MELNPRVKLASYMHAAAETGADYQYESWAGRV